MHLIPSSLISNQHSVNCKTSNGKHKLKGALRIGVRMAHLEGDWVRDTVGHAKLLGQAEGGAQISGIEGSSPNNSLVSIQVPAR